MLEANVALQSDAHPLVTSCTLGTGSTTVGRAFMTAPLLGPDGSTLASATLHEQGVVTTAGATVTLKCYANFDAAAYDISILAEPVGTLTLSDAS
jgi:hypothetical protein